MGSRRTLQGAGALVLMFLLGLLPATPVAAHDPASCPGDGLQDPGFERRLADGHPECWTTVSADAAAVVGAEDGSSFGTYAKTGVSVRPYQGARMLRLGTPKDVSESQQRGIDRVSQTFTPAADSLEFAFRLFSWEHRQRDRFAFRLVGAGGAPAGVLAQPLVLTLTDGTTRTCATTVCDVVVGGAKSTLLDTGWLRVRVEQLPTDRPLTLSYEVEGVQDMSHATWAYFDWANLPPVAKFTYLPSPGQTEQLRAGTRIDFVDLSADGDSGDRVVSWSWSVRGPIDLQPGHPAYVEHPLHGENPFFVPPRAGTYAVRLSVTDVWGNSDTVESGADGQDGVASDGTVVPALRVRNPEPLVEAVDVERLPGEGAELFGRFLDPSWPDRHQASVSVGGQPVEAVLEERNEAMLATGVVRAQWDAAGAGETAAAEGVLTVTDEHGASGQDAFAIVPVDPVARRAERTGLEQLLAADPLAREVTVGRESVSWLDPPVLGGSLGHPVDVTEVRWPGTDSSGNFAPSQPLPAGAEVLVSLRDLPADYDLVLLTLAPGGGAGLESAPSPFSTAPYHASPYHASPYHASPYHASPYHASPYHASPYHASPYHASGFHYQPVSTLHFTGLDGARGGGGDVSVDELGIGGIEDHGLRVAAVSASTGHGEEVALARLDVPGTRLFAVVSSARGEFSEAPFRLRVEGSFPFDALPADRIDPSLEFCQGEPVVAPGDASTELRTVHAGPSLPRTLFVTQAERWRALHPDGDWDGMWADLRALADHEKVRGKVVSVPSALYDDWDRTPCSVAAANEVARAIRDVIAAEVALGGYEHVVLLGDDLVVPHLRSADETMVSNERAYVVGGFLQPGTPVHTAKFLGWNMTDDHYGDMTPVGFRGRELHLPTLGVGRIVDGPDDVSLAARSFRSSNGTLSPSSGFVSGYDFFTDGAAAMRDDLAAAYGAGAVRELINGDWSADDLRCQFLGDCPGGAIAPADVNAVNAHYTHYAALSARGFAARDPMDAMTSIDVRDRPLAPGTLVFTMGCQAGLSVPAGHASAPDPGLNIDPELDLPEVMGGMGAIYVAGTGFGLGLDDGIGGTEGVMARFTRELAAGGVTAGEALARAKRHYLGSLSVVSVYDEKSAAQLVYYGLPMYDVPATAAAAGEVSQSQTLDGGELGGSALDGTAGSDTRPLAVTFVGETPDLSAQMTPHDGADGTCWAIEGDRQQTPGRPCQPRLAHQLPLPGDPVHGVLIRAGSYEEFEGFDPVMVRPTTEWEHAATQTEPRFCMPEHWPSEVVGINRADGVRQTLVVVPGQFRCTAAGEGPVAGVERLWSTLNLEVLRDLSDDVSPPRVRELSLSEGSADGMVRLTVHASDPSGISRIVVLGIGGGNATSYEPESALGDQGPYSFEVPSHHEEYLVQVVDGHGNVARLTGKGWGLRWIDVDVEAEAPSDVYAPGAVTTFTATVEQEDWDSRREPVMYRWDFGDGTVRTGPVTSQTFKVEHVYSERREEVTANLRVTDARGGVGEDDITLIHCDLPGDAALDALELDLCGILADSEEGRTVLRILAGVQDELPEGVNYRVGFDVGARDPATGALGPGLDGEPDYWVVVSAGVPQGPIEVRVERDPDDPDAIALIVPPEELALDPGERFGVVVESWLGTPGAIGATRGDRMPDRGTFIGRA